MNPAEPTPQRREIRSFVRREGRMTDSQKRALEEWWPRYGLERGQPLPAAPIVMEIGFGNGDHLLTRAASEPEKNFLGCEVHRPGVGRVLNRAHAANLKNLRVACHDAVEVLRDWLPERSLAELVVYFPDPWPKKRHHKRRLVQPPFAQLAASRLAPGGYIHVATDWEEYGAQVLEVLAATPGLRNTAPGFAPRPATRPETKFERRGLRLGHGVCDVVFRREADESADDRR